MKSTILIALLLNFFTKSFCQIDSVKILHFQTYTMYVDQLEYEFKNQVKSNICIGGSIEEGSISTIPNVKDSNSLIKVKKGGFGKYTLKNCRYGKNDTIYKILYHDNVDKNLYKIFYYENNCLVASQIRLENDNSRSEIIYSNTEYYDDSSIIYYNTKIDQIEEQLKYRIEIDAYQVGYLYLSNALFKY